MLADDMAVGFVARRLHVDLRLYREYLGSAALVAPDPLLKQIDNFMIQANDDRGERIFYRFVPRIGASLDGLEITTFDEQSHLLTEFRTQDIPSNGILDIDKGDCTGAYGYVVSHHEHGVLAYSPPYPFLRQVNISMHVGVQGNKKVSVPTGESLDSPRMEYQAGQRSTPASQSVVGGEPRMPNANARIAMAAARRERIASAKKYGQRWFQNGSREEAMRFVQSELRRAKNRVLIADPYLSGLQLGQFLYAVNPDDISVTLLSSNDAFKSNGDVLSKADEFGRLLAKLELDTRLVVKTYVLQSSILHDRFLVIDDTVWFLGNSLNTLGEKASLIVKVPNSDEIIGRLEGMLEQALSFVDYQKQKAKKKRKAGKRKDTRS